MPVSLRESRGERDVERCIEAIYFVLSFTNKAQAHPA